MKYERAQMVQRPFNFAIVDEVDSILIDEARTPLIISGPTEDKSELYMALDRIVKETPPEDYEYDEKDKRVLLTEDGTERMERLLEAAGPARRLQPLRLSRTPRSSTTSTRRCAPTSRSSATSITSSRTTRSSSSTRSPGA